MTTSIINMIIIIINIIVNMITMIFTHLCNFPTTMSSSSSSSNPTIPSNILSLISNASHLVVFIGAGASASSGLATFRGVGALVGAAQVREDALDAVFPNVTHRAVAELVRCGRVKFVVSSNHDNLSGKAGVPRTALAELFGNAYVEKCLKCNREMLRSTVTPALQRVCEHCGVGRLVKAGVRYGQSVPEEPVRQSEAAMKLCDVALVLGSGMHTNPFADLALRSPNVVVVNLGATGADGRRNVAKVDSDSDSFMQALCDSLQITVPDFEFRQRVRCGWRNADNNEEEIELYVAAFAKQEAVTFASECEFSIGGISRSVDADMRWEFRTTVRRPLSCESFQITLEPKAAYAGAVPLVVNVELGATPHEQVAEFVFPAVQQS
jgi:NAD-dependent SIR2 family protein deacetylase